jgi:polar amino acid transport system substrate-binding protein
MNKKFFAAMAAGVLSAAVFTSCGSVPENTVHSIDDLEGKVIGVQLGTVGDLYASDVKDASVQQYNKGADAVQALKQGKVDAVIIDNAPAEEFVAKNDDLEILSDKYDPEEYAIAIKKGNDELTDEINGALKTLSENGTLDKIESNWIGEDKGNNPYTSPSNVERTKGTLTMATNAEFPPYESKENGEIVGFDVDMMQAVCDELGYELEIDDMAFDSIIAAVDSGKADVGVAGMTVTKDRLKNVNFSDTYTSAEQVVIVRKK